MQAIIKNLLMMSACAIIFNACSPSRVVVRERPSAPYIVKPAPPYANAVWMDGEWISRGRRYEYSNPHYVTPRRGRAWVPGHWITTRRGNIWVKGRWR